MAKCVFCGKEESAVRGVHLMANDGTVNYFCSSKCRKNSLKLKRDKRKVKWTESYKLAREKRLKSEADRKAQEAEKPSKLAIEKTAKKNSSKKK
ncbi:50S ribosomal protein L24e [Candidatus Pacearchaeota archaeon CG10_big_fil_rev_8_21_14_0_10_31_24]|nr:MAG: 50S ribosomal protein L24e [Candidatus Pacearchaeota archaeon CG10_big_fil_rev_8_21_14_0_10_31_24]